jgi:hypothetical protein
VQDGHFEEDIFWNGEFHDSLHFGKVGKVITVPGSLPKDPKPWPKPNSRPRRPLPVWKPIIATQPDDTVADCRIIVALMQKATGEEPKMWGTSMVGYGRYAYKGKSGREGEWMVIGFSPRKAALSLYILMGFEKEDTLDEETW